LFQCEYGRESPSRMSSTTSGNSHVFSFILAKKLAIFSFGLILRV
jgi:hypothetical protein